MGLAVTRGGHPEVGDGYIPDATDSMGEARRWMGFRSDFVLGVRDIAPLVPAAAIVGAVTGIAAITVGLTPAQAIVMSLLVYYPSVMLTAFVLLQAATPLVVLIPTSLVVGARSVMYSLSLAPHLSRFSIAWKWFLAYLLWTPVYAFSIAKYESKPTIDKRGYYLGTATPLWVSAQLAVIGGVAFGQGVPPSLQLEFVIPLAFIALLMRFVKDRPTLVAALVGGVMAVAGGIAPMNLGILIGASCGTGAGYWLHRRGVS